MAPDCGAPASPEPPRAEGAPPSSGYGGWYAFFGAALVAPTRTALPSPSSGSSGSGGSGENGPCCASAQALLAPWPADTAGGPAPAQRRPHVPHVAQRDSWDCGLACVLMALRALGFDWQVVRYQDLLMLCPTNRSVWTIDLAHLLARFRVRVTLATVTIGADQSYAQEAFYAPQWGADTARVARLFDDAPAAGITVEQRSVPLRELCRLVGGGTHLAIVLVDRRITDPHFEWARAALWSEGFESDADSGAAAGSAGSADSGGDVGTDSEDGGGDELAAAGGGGAAGTRTWQEYWSSYYYVIGWGGTSTRRGSCGGGRGGARQYSKGQQQREARRAARAGAATGWAAYYYYWLPPGSSFPEQQDGQEQEQEQGQEQERESQQEREREQQGHGTEPTKQQECPRLQPQPCASGYAGHYLLLVGYDAATRRFWVQDPAKALGPCLLAAELLEAGRRAHGTDEDLLLIPQLPRQW